MSNRVLCLWLCVAVAALAMSCGGGIPTPPTGPHRGSEPTIVPYPPPPARVEIVPPPPPELEGAVWVDGEWLWKGRRWVWQPGLWEVPYPGAYFAPSATARLGDGRLAWFPGRWHFPERAAQRRPGEAAR